MLQRKYRLKKYSAFIATYKKNNAVSDENVCIYYGKEKTNTDTNTKFGFVVSKKIHKRAVVRNRIKRLMRESVRLYIKNNKDLKINKYISVIFVAKKNAINKNFETINNTILNLLSNK